MKIVSDSKKTFTLSIFMALLGVILLLLTWRHRAHSNNAFYGFWLGVGLLVLSSIVLLFFEEVLMIVDEKTKLIRLKKSGVWGSRSKMIPFAQVESVQLGRVGRRGRGLESYHLSLILKSGKSEKTGRWSFQFDEIETEADKLAQIIGCTRTGALAWMKPTTSMYFAAVVISIVAYMGWYRFQVGPWCRAMWFGTAPPVFMVSVFFFIVRLSRLPKKR